jgi:hypothetical protein
MGMSGADEAVALGKRLGDAYRRRDHLEPWKFEVGSDPTPAIYFKNAAEDASDIVNVLRDTLCVVMATTLAGAAVQIAEAIARLDLLGEGSESSELRAVHRLLYSALDVVGGLADRKLAEVVTPDFDNRHIDPWRPVEERLAPIEPAPRGSWLPSTASGRCAVLAGSSGPAIGTHAGQRRSMTRLCGSTRSWTSEGVIRPFAAGRTLSDDAAPAASVARALLRLQASDAGTYEIAE